MIRSVIFFTWLVLSVIPCAMAIVLASIFVRGAPLYWLAVCWLTNVIHAARLIGGVNWRVQGLENLPAADTNHPVILCPKHQSTWETFAMPMIMPQPLAYVFKRELLMIPLFGWAIARLDMVHIDRGRPQEAWEKVARQGRELLARGLWIIMFPEGTRTVRGAQGRYKFGPARLARATGAMLVPIAVTSGQCWPRRSFRLRPGVIDVSIGPPILPEGRDPEDLISEVEHWIEREMRRLTPDDYA